MVCINTSWCQGTLFRWGDACLATASVLFFGSKKKDMADVPVVRIESNSPEKIAYELMKLVAISEKKLLTPSPGPASFDKKWLLDTYAECLDAVRNGISARSVN